MYKKIVNIQSYFVNIQYIKTLIEQRLYIIQ